MVGAADAEAGTASAAATTVAVRTDVRVTGIAGDLLGRSVRDGASVRHRTAGAHPPWGCGDALHGVAPATPGWGQRTVMRVSPSSPADVAQTVSGPALTPIGLIPTGIDGPARLEVRGSMRTRDCAP